MVPRILTGPEHERENAHDDEKRADAREGKDRAVAQIGFDGHAACEVHEQIDAGDFDQEEHPFGGPEPDEVVNQRRNAAGIGDCGGKPDAGAGDRAEHVAEDQQEGAVFADKVKVLGLVGRHRTSCKPRKDKRGTDRSVRKQHVDRGDEADHPSRTDAGLKPGRVESEELVHGGSPSGKNKKLLTPANALL